MKINLFIEKAQAVHGNKYDYSKVEYVNYETKVCIICPEHGEFWQAPHNHLKGRGCPVCKNIAISNARKLSRKSPVKVKDERTKTEKFIDKARKIHGDKYDYSKVDYVNNITKVCIICPEHGEFWQTPHTHLSNKGCPLCGIERIRLKKSHITTEMFIESARAIHGDKYDYSKTVYDNSDETVCIICPEHGEFWQTPNNHLKGKGCPICGTYSRKYSKVETHASKFIAKAKEVHHGFYDYSKVKYENNHTKVIITCPIHGDFLQRPYSHMKGEGCPKCGLEERIGKHTMAKEEFVKQARLVHGDKYEYVGDYVNSATPIKMVCPIHGEFEQTPNNHLRGKGCPKCGNVKISQRLRYSTEEFIAKANDKHGNKYDYSKVDMLNRDEKGRICIICPEHGEFWMRPSNHLSGRGCPKCSLERASKKMALTKEEFLERSYSVHGNRYDYSKVEYVNAETKVCIKCSEHGEFWQIPPTHLRGCGCPLCGVDKTALAQRLSLKDFVSKANVTHNGKYTYKNAIYKGSKVDISITCPQHGDFMQSPENHLRGHGCPKCQHQQSKPELEIIEFLKQYLKPEQIIERNREILDGREIDILLPDFRIGIEFNGLHWHSHKFKQDRYYHKNKMDIANSKGFRLIQIFEDEWVSHKDIVLNKLRHFVGADMNERCIGARKCDIKTINHLEAKEFLSAYHIQGYVPSTVYLGAYYNDELVGVMSFTEEQPKMWNLMRFTTKTDYRLPGLANKLFKYFLKNYEYVEVKSFLDLRWNQSLDGNTVYDKLGFVLDSYVAPDYRYIVGSERKHKFGFRKNILHKKYGLPLTMTEKEMCDELGFERIYDCGLAKFVYKNNPQSA